MKGDSREEHKPPAVHNPASCRFPSAVSIFSLVFLLGVVPPGFAADPVDILETWTVAGTGGWSHANTAIELSNPTNYLNLRFPYQEIPMSQNDTTYTSILFGIAPTNISLDFQAFDIQPSSLSLRFHASVSDRNWTKALSLPPVGSWEYYETGVSMSNGWTRPFATEEQFAEDILCVDTVSVYIARRDGLEQDYGIDNFRIRGYGLDMDGDEMSDFWESRYGLNPWDANDAFYDGDFDSANNYEEFRAGTAPNNWTSVFTLTFAVSNVLSNTHAQIRWQSLPHRTYTVWRAESMLGSFSQISGELVGTAPSNTYTDTAATNEESYFYQIRIRE